MANMIKTTSYENTKNILLAPKLAYAIPIKLLVDGDIFTTIGDRKYILAGTPVSGVKQILSSKTYYGYADEGALGVVLYDVDVTDYEDVDYANCTLLISGIVDVSKLHPSVVNSIKSNYAGYKADGNPCFPHITFIDGEYAEVNLS